MPQRKCFFGRPGWVPGFKSRTGGVAGGVLLALCLSMAMLVQGQQAPTEKGAGRGSKKEAARFSEAALQAFSSLEPIDTHVHVFKDAPVFQDMLNRFHLHVLTILVVDDHRVYQSHLEPMRRDAFKFVEESEGRAKLCTTWDPYLIYEPNFAKEAIEGLNRDFAKGAIAVKIWKNYGMEIKDADGKYILPDDPRLEPIYKDIEAHHKTLLAHLAEPDAAWNPVNGAPYARYYQENPQWNMSKQPGAPTKEAILDARDHVLAMNPKLRVVGAHIGSMEADVDQVAARLDKYPNFAVDTAARTVSFEIQPREKVRNFIIKYQDRIVYGTDLGFYPEANPEQSVREWESHYAGDWRFFATDDKFQVQGHDVEGLALPREVLQKLYHDNAVRWFPGIGGNPKTGSKTM